MVGSACEGAVMIDAKCSLTGLSISAANGSHRRMMRMFRGTVASRRISEDPRWLSIDARLARCESPGRRDSDPRRALNVIKDDQLSDVHETVDPGAS